MYMLYITIDYMYCVPVSNDRYIMYANGSRDRYGLKAEPWCSPTFTPKLLLSPAALRTTVLRYSFESIMVKVKERVAYFFRKIR